MTSLHVCSGSEADTFSAAAKSPLRAKTGPLGNANIPDQAARQLILTMDSQQRVVFSTELLMEASSLTKTYRPTLLHNNSCIQ